MGRTELKDSRRVKNKAGRVFDEIGATSYHPTGGNEFFIKLAFAY
jgi:hypothetical protein